MDMPSAMPRTFAASELKMRFHAKDQHTTIDWQTCTFPRKPNSSTGCTEAQIRP